MMTEAGGLIKPSITCSSFGPRPQIITNNSAGGWILASYSSNARKLRALGGMRPAPRVPGDPRIK